MVVQGLSLPCSCNSSGMWDQHMVWAWICTEAEAPWEVWCTALPRKVFGQASSLNAKGEVEPLSKLTLAWEVLHRVLMRLSSQSIFYIRLITSATYCARRNNTCLTYVISLHSHPTWKLGTETVERLLPAAFISPSPSSCNLLTTCTQSGKVVVCVSVADPWDCDHVAAVGQHHKRGWACIFLIW